MTFPILGGNGAVAGYEIANSLRFNNDDSARLTNTAGTPTSTSTGTFSFWIKKTVNNNAGQKIYSTLISATPSQSFQIAFSGANADGLQMDMGNDVILETSALYRDNSAFYHFVIAIDQSQGTASNKIKVYVNGVQQTSFAVDNRSTYGSTSDLGLSINGQKRVIGSHMNETQNFLDGYLTEFYFIDGQQLDASSFGEFDEDSGIWKPIQYTGSYGTNGFYLDFENSGSLGADQSGNGNNFTPTNLASTDQTTDTPTNNFATLNPLDTYNSPTLSEGNTKIVRSSGYGIATGTVAMKTGKWYWEIQCPTVTTSGENESFGISKVTSNIIGNNYLGIDTNSWALMLDNATDIYFNHNNSFTDSGINASNGDIFMFALDADTGKLWFGRNGTWFDSGNPSAGTNQKYTANTDDVYYVAVSMNGNDATLFNFGNPAFSISSGNSDQNGYGNFEYAPPSGYLALCTQNLATALSPTIDDGSQYFNTSLWNGNSSTQSITGVGFQPDFVWLKSRTNTASHRLNDSNRGVNKQLASNSADAETSFTTMLTSFDSDGFTLGNNVGINGTGYTNVGWSWKANGGTTSSNTDGSITSTVQANTTAGFSIVTYTGNATAGATIGHGLGVTPSMFIIKGRTLSGSWVTFHQDLGATKALALQGSNAPTTSSAYFNNTAPTSSVITLGYDGAGNEVNNGSDTFVAYCFAEIEGYSKFGSYTGNGSSDGTFVYTGFRPAFLIIKRTDSGSQWKIQDSKRLGYNPSNSDLYADSSEVENAVQQTDFLSNGWKCRNSTVNLNGSGNTYIYMAFAENPFASSSGVPVVAR